MSPRKKLTVVVPLAELASDRRAEIVQAIGQQEEQRAAERRDRAEQGARKVLLRLLNGSGVVSEEEASQRAAAAGFEWDLENGLVVTIDGLRLMHEPRGGHSAEGFRLLVPCPRHADSLTTQGLTFSTLDELGDALTAPPDAKGCGICWDEAEMPEETPAPVVVARSAGDELADLIRRIAVEQISESVA